MSETPTFDIQGGFKLGDWRVEPRLGELHSLTSGQAVHLRPKAMEVLLELAASGGDVVERETLRDNVWPETLASDESLSRCVADVRAALASEGDDRAYIETLPKRGYRLVVGIEPPAGESTRAPEATTLRGRIPGIALVVLLITAAVIGLYSVDWPDAALESAPQRSGAPAPRAEQSIAVLPFVNRSLDEEQAYFADGLSEELMNVLSQIPNLRVAARTSSFSFKNSDLDIPEIAARLNVAHVLEGSVRKQGDQLRITAQLIQADDGFHLWSETYDRRLENIFALQDELATDIARKLELELGGIDVVPNRTSNFVAYDSYLMGLAALRRRSAEATAFFQESIFHDPSFAPAWAGLAIAFQSGLGVDSDSQERAIESARRALELDPQNVAALTAMASVFRQTRRWRESERVFERALAVDPGSAELLEDYTEFLNLVGRLEEAVVYSSRGMDIDPRLLPLVAAHVEALLGTGRLAQARSVALATMETYGDSFGYWYVLLPLWIAPVEGMLQPLPPTVELPDLARDIGEWLERPSGEVIESLEATLSHREDHQSDSPFPVDVARLLLLHHGEVDPVIDHDIANAIVEFPSDSREWLWTPLFDQYRAHPRFPELLSRVGLIDYWDETAWPEACRREESGRVTCR